MNRKNDRKLIYAMLLWAYALFGIIASVLAFASCFGLFGKSVKFYICIIIAAGAACTVFAFSVMRNLLMTVYIAAFFVFAVLRYKSFISGAAEVINNVIDRVNASYGMGYGKISIQYAYDVRDKELFLIFAVALITVIICYFTLGCFNLIVTIAVTLLLNSFGIFYDIFPELIYLGMSVVFWTMTVCLYCCGSRKRNVPDSAVLSAYVTGLIIVLVFVISSRIFPQEKYSRTDNAVKLESIITDSLNKLKSQKTFFDEIINVQSSGIGHGEFGHQDGISYTGETMLVVKLPYTAGNIYLRGAEYSRYKGNSWGNENTGYNSFRKKLKELSDCNIVNETYTLLDGVEDYISLFMEPDAYNSITDEYFVTVENVGEGNYAFAPYGAYVNNDGQSDRLSENKTRKISYNVYYAEPGTFLNRINFDILSGISPSDETEEFIKMVSYEKEYSEFVKKVYTKVPDDLKDVLKKYAPETVSYDYKSELQFAKKIQDMFNEAYSYTLNPGKVPAGMDGVEYFLEENKKGYCVYFASAATLIFRMAGIPARYVEGYVVSPAYDGYDSSITFTDRRYIAGERFLNEKEYVTVSVKDSSAHAWTEIYIPEYGWTPIEVTPGYSVAEYDFSSGEDEYMTEEHTDNSREDTDSQTDSESAPKDDNEENSTTDSQKEMLLPGDSDSESGSLENLKDILTVLKSILLIMMVIFLAAFLVIMWKKHADKKINMLIHGVPGTGSRERAIEVWNYLERMSAYLGDSLDEEITYEERCTRLTEKLMQLTGKDYEECINSLIGAYFGNKELNEEQSVEAGAMVKKLRRSVLKNLTGLKKLYFMYVRRL